MKKLFMIAAVAGLTLGAVSCAKNSNENGVAKGDETGMRLSIVLPAGGSTRATDFGDIAATTEESAIKTLDVFLFNPNGSVAKFGGHTPIATFSSAFTQQGSTSVYKMNNPIEATAGKEMRIWVAANLPNVPADGFATETEMLAAFETVANMSDNLAAEGLAMFSNVETADLAVMLAGADFSTVEGTNTVAVNMFRVVSKIIATSTYDDTDSATVADFTSDWGDADASLNLPELTLAYTPLHWYVMQHSTSSWVAPHYDVAAYNATTGAVIATRPVTYDEAISTYATDAAIANKINLKTSGTDAVLSAYTVAANDARYIGENARVGATNALTDNTTYAFISTGVVANMEAVWDTTTKDIIWQDAAANYGYGQTSADVWLFKYKGQDYITSSDNNIGLIVGGISREEGITVVADTETPTTGQMKESDYYAHINMKVYKYTDGYVHFPYYINKMADNQYEILRNQFIHLSVTGMADANIGTFPGYPGDPNQPEVPIDINDPTDNPDPKYPPQPVDETETQMKVTVTVKDWTYRVNEIELSK